MSIITGLLIFIIVFAVIFCCLLPVGRMVVAKFITKTVTSQYLLITAERVPRVEGHDNEEDETALDDVIYLFDNNVDDSYE